MTRDEGAAWSLYERMKDLAIHFAGKAAKCEQKASEQLSRRRNRRRAGRGPRRVVRRGASEVKP